MCIRTYTYKYKGTCKMCAKIEHCTVTANIFQPPALCSTFLEVMFISKINVFFIAIPDQLHNLA